MQNTLLRAFVFEFLLLDFVGAADGCPLIGSAEKGVRERVGLFNAASRELARLGFADSAASGGSRGFRWKSRHLQCPSRHGDKVMMVGGRKV